MALLAALLLLLLLLLPLAALVLGTVLLGLPSYEIPPGVNQPAKLRLVLAVLLGTAALVSPATAPRSRCGDPRAPPAPAPGAAPPPGTPRLPAPRAGSSEECAGPAEPSGSRAGGRPPGARRGRQLLGQGGKPQPLRPLLRLLTFLVQNPVRAALLNPRAHFYSIA